MNLESASDKHLNDMERLSIELIEVMRKAKLSEEPLMKLLYDLNKEAGNARRERFDSHDSKYNGY